MPPLSRRYISLDSDPATCRSGNRLCRNGRRLMSQLAKRIFRYFRILITLIALPAIWLTYLHLVRPRLFASIGTEVQRLESPDQEVQAVVMETNPGALEPFYYTVYLAKVGSRRLGNPVLDAFGKNDLKLRWISPRLLEISYTDACIG